MANDLVSTPWSPPEADATKKVIKYGTYSILVLGSLVAFLVIGPTIDDAVVLANKILVDTWHMAMYGVGLLVTLAALHSLLTPNGKLNQLVRMPYNSVINGLTRFFMTIDPWTPIDMQIKAVRADQALFETQYQKMYGIVSNLREKEDALRHESAQSQREGIAATRMGKADAARLATYKFGSAKDAADRFAAMRGKLEPILTTFQGISQAADLTAKKLEFDRGMLKTQWDAQAAVGGAVDSANRILGRSKTAAWQQAEAANEFITTKYAEELGHLDYLKKSAQPFMDSIDIETGAYSEEMLANVRNSGAQLTRSTEATTLPPPPALNAPSVSSDTLADFLPR